MTTQPDPAATEGDELTKQVRTLTTSRNALETDLSAAHARIAELTAERDNWMRLAELKEVKGEANRTENNNLRGVNDTLRATVEQLTQRLAEVEHELENVWKPAAAMNEQYARAYETKLTAAAERIRVLEGERDEAQKTLVRLEATPKTEEERAYWLSINKMWSDSKQDRDENVALRAQLDTLRAATAADTKRLKDLSERIRQYLLLGGLFNPENMEHDKVRALLMDIRCAIEMPNAAITSGGKNGEGEP
jgi:chromosome segregation ATPase